MQSVQVGMWDPRPPSKHVSPLPQPPPSNLRLAHVTTATPAKRITFYKSGDSQFGGIRMAVHKRSFKCFDALLDDLSQKVPLPFGVRTVTTPRGTHAIKHLEQLQDGGCYLCSDRRQAKPVNMELASKRPTIWYHQSHRPHRPESSSATPPGHLSYRQRRIMLVKNSEPGMRRSIVLSRRSTRSLRAFLDDVSEVMQFHVRKLYTAEGRRIDSVQSLITCPGVLVCVGREAFSPLLVNFIRKSSEEKLPGLGPRTPGNGARSPATQGTRSSSHGVHSGASEYSEGHESKKNVNFGLETKKSIIHPRSDSSNRSTRFSLSSEKSYGNGVSTYSQARPGIVNEDIEKRVLVNKDGSLSVEMRVRFRLQNEETLQWSTQIKKSPTTNECCSLSQAQPHYLQQGQSESCSDPDSTSFDPEGVDYSSQPLHRVSEGNHCPCCYQRPEQQYDLWENPAHIHKKPPVPPPHTSSHTMMRHTHSSSSSSSCNSRRVVRCRARLSNCGGGSGSEQSQLVQEEMCLTEQVERRVEVEQDGDTHVKVHRVSRCCSRSEVVAMDTNLRPLSQKSVEDEVMMEDEEERPLSAISSSSHILRTLKEDQDDDLPPSVSQCGHSNGPSPSPAFATRNASACSIHSTKHNKQVDGGERGSRAISAASSCHCGGATPHSTAEAEADDEDEEIKRAVSGLSGHTGSQSRTSSVCPNCGGCKRGGNSVSNSRASQRSHHFHRASPKPATPHSNQENANNGSDDDDGSDVSAVSTQSNKTNLTKCGRSSAISNVLEGRASSPMSTTSDPEATGKEEVEERAPSATSATSHMSNRSHKSGCNSNKEEGEERSHSAMSAQSSLSAKSRKSHKSNCNSTADAPDTGTGEEEEGENAIGRALSSLSAKSGASLKPSDSQNDNTAMEEDGMHKRSPSALSVKSNTSGKAERPDSVLSAKSTKSHVSAKSGTSHKSTCSHCVRAVSLGVKAADEPVIEATCQEEGMEAEKRAASAMSAKSNKSHKSTKASERSHSPRSETGGDGEKRAASQMSGRSLKSNASVKSSKSCKSNNNGIEIEVSPSLRVAEEKDEEMVEEETQQRPQSVISTKLENEERADSAGSSKSHKSKGNENTEPISETGDNAADGEKAEDRAASALSGKSASSAKSCHTNCDASSRLASPAKETAKPEVDSMEDRAPSAMSGKSHASAKSSKSQKSNRTAASPNPNKAGVPSIETNGGEKQNEERVASAMSVKSKSSHKSNSSKNLKSVSLSPNVTIKTPEGVDKEGNDTTERAQSAASAKSGKSYVSAALSDKGAADIAVIETADEKVVEDNAPRSRSSEHSCGQTLAPRRTRSPRTHSPKAPAVSPRSPHPVRQLSPGPNVGETRGPSALSVHSRTSAKSSRSNCHCGAASAKKDKEVEDKEEEKREDNEEASERAASVLSSSTTKQRRESGGSEQPLSRNSSGSVSLGLPEDQETADSDSGKSSFNFPINAESKGIGKTATPNVPRSTEQSAMKEDVEETRSPMSENSNHNGSKSTSSHNPPAVDIPTIETPGQSEDKGEDGGEQKTVRASSALSAKSNRSHKSCCNCSVKAAAQLLDTTANNMNASDNRTSSALSSASAKIRSKSPASASVKDASVAKTTGDSANNDTEPQAISRPASKAKGKDVADNKAARVHSKSPCCLKPKSATSSHSDSLNPVKGHKAKSSGSIKTSNPQKKETAIESSSPCSEHSSRPNSKVESCTESILSHSLSAADLLKETMAAARPQSRQSKASKTSDKPKSEKSGRSQKSRNQADQEELELTPASLPNASPNEVVSDWLRSIPTDSTMLAVGDELHEEEAVQEKAMEEKTGDEAAKEEEESPEDEKEEEKDEAEEEEEKEEEAECDAAEEEKSSDPAPGDAEGTSPRSNTQQLLSNESLPRNWHSSVAVMKVLLSSSPGRCRSMPEVSAVYGRRLSTSARGFLDCLAQLQLIEPVVSPTCDQQKDCNQRYEDIMAILQSLWLTEPGDIEAKDVSKEQVTPPRSSSGVDMSSGSGGSGKENENQGGDETTQNKTNEEESLHEDEEAEKVVEEDEEGNAEVGHKEIEAEPDETSTEQTKTIDEETAQETVQSEEQSTVPPSLDSPKATENPSSSEANDSSKSPTDNERETLESSSSGTPPTVLRASLSRKVSQDPDPVWVLHLLKKLEKQFMNHYINAMAEFKVRWDLDDSLILNTMISELRDEVSRRIQSSIQREMKKIQSRAGRLGKLPRPPQGENLSRESTMTEKRRRMLKVMKNQSVKTGESLSDGEMTGDCSDQRSDDEYCPCDACVRKKMAARPLKTNPPAAEAPVMMEFDLLKILQLKKSPSPAAVPPSAEEEDDSMAVDEDGRNLEVVQEEEEEEETKEDIKADVVLEETIPEEAEEIEDVGEAGEGEEVEEEKEGNSVGDEEQVEGGEEAGEEETSENGEAEEAQCQCQCGGTEEESDKAEEGEEVEEETAEGEDAEETSNNTGEDETADDEEKAGEEEGESAEDEGETGGNEGETETGEEESDKETVKEATTGEDGETTEHSEGEEKEEEAEAEEFKPEEEEETTGKESGEEEASGETKDDSGAKNSTNDESTSPAEEFVEGNVSASAEAEDEDDGDDGTGEGEESGEQEKEASEEEEASPQEQGMTEGEEADAEESDSDNKRPSDTSADELGREGAGATGEEGEKDGGEEGGEEEAVEDAVEESKPEDKDGEVKRNKRENAALLHQFTRTSVESQPGSLEDINTESPQNPVNSIEVPKVSAGVSSGGGAGQRRSRSPARVKRRKPKECDEECDEELDDY